MQKLKDLGLDDNTSSSSTTDNGTNFSPGPMAHYAVRRSAKARIMEGASRAGNLRWPVNYRGLRSERHFSGLGLVFRPSSL